MPIWSWIPQHRAWSLSMGLFLLLAAGAAVVYLVVLRTTSTPLNLRQAVRLYRTRQSPASASDPPGIPLSGVYQYQTSGEESLNILGMSRTYPRTTSMIVTTRSCASVRWEPVTQHVEEISECIEPRGGLALRSSVTKESIAGISTHTVITCPSDTYLRPPKATVGDRWSSTCHSAGAPVHASGVVLGRAHVSIGGRAVGAWHTELTFSFAGAYRGTSPTQYWLAIPTDLLLAEREAVHVSEHASPLGPVLYREQMSAKLRSLTPRG